MEEEIILTETEPTVDWETMAEKLRAENRRLTLKMLFCKAGCKDEEYLCYRFLNEAEFDGEDVLVNSDSILTKAKEECGDFFKTAVIEGVRPVENSRPIILDRKGFAKMNYQERAKLYRNDPELYKQLSGRE